MEYCQCPSLLGTQRNVAVLIHHSALRSGPRLKAWWIWAHCALTQQAFQAENLFSMNFIPCRSGTSMCFRFSLPDCWWKLVGRSNINNYFLIICEFLYTTNLCVVLYPIVEQLNCYMLYVGLVLVIPQNRKDTRFNSSLWHRSGVVSLLPK